MGSKWQRGPCSDQAAEESIRSSLRKADATDL